MSGYSKTKLIDKLGIKEGYSVYFQNVPDNFFDLLGRLPDGLRNEKRLRKHLMYIHYFAENKRALENNFIKLKNFLAMDGMLWISWPKLASKVKTDLNESIVREIGLQNGLVDVKVCAVDDKWSGLKFVYRVKDRKLTP